MSAEIIDFSARQRCLALWRAFDRALDKLADDLPADGVPYACFLIAWADEIGLDDGRVQNIRAAVARHFGEDAA